MNTSFEVNRKKTTTTWLTPIDIIKSLGEFDLDPCTPIEMPWQTAKKRYTEIDNGLIQPWEGRVWLNPPYGKGMDLWLKKLKEHGNGIALVFNRSESKQFFDHVWNDADAVFFKKGRIHFLNNEGKKVGNGSGSGSMFIAYGAYNCAKLRDCKMQGKYIQLK